MLTDPAFCCDICKETIHNPMALPCLHTFCSLCIRLSLKSQLKCPTCSEVCKGSMELKKNHFVQQILDYLLKTDEFKPKEESSLPEGRSKRKITEFVDCPLCAKQVLLKHINAHMDSKCRSHIKQKQVLVKKGSVPYDLYKLAQLKQILLQDGLPTHGDRKQMIKRHSYFVELFNSNCDSSNPRSTSELLKMVIEWENNTSGTKIQFGKNADEDKIIVDAHMKCYGSQFEDMIRSVRQKQEQSKKIKLDNDAESPTIVCLSDTEHEEVSTTSGILDEHIANIDENKNELTVAAENIQSKAGEVDKRLEYQLSPDEPEILHSW